MNRINPSKIHLIRILCILSLMKPNLTEKEKQESAIYQQRFEMLMKLIRIDRMLRSAKIVYPDKDATKNGHSG